MKYCAAVFIGILSLGGLLSCGLEAYYYIDYIPLSDYRVSSSAINLPSSSAEGYSTYFNNFVIFYRLYTSGTDFPSTVLTADSRSAINATLNSDYNVLYSYTDTASTSVSTANLENTFDARNYFKLTLEGVNINDVLGSQSLGRRLEIFFSTNNGEQPTLRLNGGTPYFLLRATEGQSRLFSPEPNRRFLNDPTLRDSAKAYPNATNINADVVAAGSGETRYTYVSMYIAASGISLEMPPQTIYSQPTFIGIFRLANSGS